MSVSTFILVNTSSNNDEIIVHVHKLFMANPSQSYRASHAIWNHTTLPANQRRWTHLALTQARQAGTAKCKLVWQHYSAMTTTHA